MSKDWYGITRSGYYIEGSPSLLRRILGRLVGERWSRNHKAVWPQIGGPGNGVDFGCPYKRREEGK